MKPAVFDAVRAFQESVDAAQVGTRRAELDHHEAPVGEDGSS